MRTDMSEEDASLIWLRGFLAGRIGVIIPEDRPEFIPSRLSGMLRQYQLNNLSALVAQIRGGNHTLLAVMIDVLTTHETSFFRDPDVYAWLETESLPALVKQASGREMVIWSAACSTGQEALSVGILLMEGWPTQNFRILGSDISPGTVERARTGIYPLLEVNRGLSARRLMRWFARHGADYKVVPELSTKIQFHIHNLLDKGWPTQTVDMVLLRNVMIYLGTSDREQVFRNLAAAMRPGSIVVLGTAEALIEPPPGLFRRERSAKSNWLIRT